MSGDQVIDALREQGRETRQQLAQLREAMTVMAKSVSDLTTTLARVEERHARQDDILRRLGKQTDDHEQRLRQLEKVSDPEKFYLLEQRVDSLEDSKSRASGAWRTLTVIGGVAAAIATLLLSLLNLTGVPK